MSHRTSSFDSMGFEPTTLDHEYTAVTTRTGRTLWTWTSFQISENIEKQLDLCKQLSSSPEENSLPSKSSFATSTTTNRSFPERRQDLGRGLGLGDLDEELAENDKDWQIFLSNRSVTRSSPDVWRWPYTRSGLEPSSRPCSTRDSMSGNNFNNVKASPFSYVQQ